VDGPPSPGGAALVGSAVFRRGGGRGPARLPPDGNAVADGGPVGPGVGGPGVGEPPPGGLRSGDDGPGQPGGERRLPRRRGAVRVPGGGPGWVAGSPAGGDGTDDPDAEALRHPGTGVARQGAAATHCLWTTSARSTSYSTANSTA